MRKFYSLIAVTLLSATAMMAQNTLPSVKSGKLNPAMNGMQKKTVKPNLKTVGTVALQAEGRQFNINKGIAKAKAAPKTRATALAANQKYVGAYTSDSYIEDEEKGLGLNMNQDITILSYLYGSVTEKLNGGKIVGMRYALASAADVSEVMVWKADRNGNISPWLSQKISTTSPKGWNTVMFTTPGEINLSDIAGGILAGFIYKQESGRAPLSFVEEGSYNAPTYLYGNYGQGEGLYNLGADGLNMSVQLIVESDNFPAKDAVINDMVISRDWTKIGNSFNYAFDVNNEGTQTIGNLEVGIYIDGNLVSQNDVSNVTSISQVVEGSITIPADLALGQHILSVWAVNADGTKLTEFTDDDMMATYFYVYDKTLARQKTLVEQFTSQYCVYCQDGATNLKNFVDTRNGDIAWVSVHGDMQNGPDQFTISAGGEIMTAEAVGGFPSASFNRTVVNGDLALGLYYGSNFTAEALNNYFNEVVDFSYENSPCLATVNISGAYDEATRKLDVTVKGNGVDVEQLLANYGLTVLLTEDGITARQKNAKGQWTLKYIHDHVLRAALTDALGTKINWTGDTYEMTFSTTLNASWNADNVNVVAFVAPIVDINSEDGINYAAEWITNANSVSLKNISTGIKGVYNNGADAVETARYNAAGQVISAPQKGLNIIKMSNGETRKVIVK